MKFSFVIVALLLSSSVLTNEYFDCLSSIYDVKRTIANVKAGGYDQATSLKIGIEILASIRSCTLAAKKGQVPTKICLTALEVAAVPAAKLNKAIFKNASEKVLKEMILGLEASVDKIEKVCKYKN